MALHNNLEGSFLSNVQLLAILQQYYPNTVFVPILYDKDSDGRGASTKLNLFFDQSCLNIPQILTPSSFMVGGQCKETWHTCL